MAYSENDIQKLTDLEHVRKRPTMYVGDTGMETILIPTVHDGKLQLRYHEVSLGYLTCVREIIDNAIDVIRFTGKGSTVKIDFDGHFFRVQDNSVGVPIGVHNGTKEHVPEVVFGHLRSGKNFDTDALIIGMNGMGASITNFLSDTFQCTIYREGKHYHQSWVKGQAHKKHIKKTNHVTGTDIKFSLESEFFDGYVPGIEVKDFVSLIARLNTDITFFYNGQKILTNSLRDFRFSEDGEEEQYQIFTSVNGVPTFFGGTHETEFENMLLDRVKKALKLKGDNVHRSNLLNGLCVFIALNDVPDILFDSQAKTRLITKNIDRYMEDVENGIYKFVKQEKDGWLEWINEQFERKKVAKRIRAKKGTSVPGYHHAKDLNDSEVYIVEGESAKSNFLSVRSPNQGILPIKGKIMNVKERKLSEVVKSDTVINLIEMLSINVAGTSHDCPYSRIIIATDADPDGLHIQSLLINFFQFVCPDLMERVHIIQSPLYVVEGTKGYYQIYYDKESFGKVMHNGKDVRYNKGLGSLERREWEEMVDPERRSITKIDITDKKKTKKTIERIFGASSELRKKWLGSDLPIYKL